MTSRDVNRAEQQAAEFILQGKILIYPTETLYALGANALDWPAVNRVVELKGRPQGKPLPVIIGSLQQVHLVASRISSGIRSLAETFWPGPLSILLPARCDISPQARDETGWTSVRWSSHPGAQRLCRCSGVPLVATSANVAGAPAVSRPEALDPALVAGVDFVLPGYPMPSGGLPSTVVRVLDDRTLSVVRQGAIAVSCLQAKGWMVQVQDARHSS